MKGTPFINTIEAAESFRTEAIAEIDREKQVLEAVNQPRKSLTAGWIIVFVILGVAVLILFQSEFGFLFWILIAFILYGFNFLIWFIPTTRRRADPEEKVKMKFSGSTIKGPILYLLKKKKRLGVEIGMTMFLSGMVPLALSFFILFGIGIAMGLYFAFIRNLYDHNQMLGIIAQMIVILAFFIILVILRPQERGFARTARRFKGHYTSARSKGRVATIFIITMFGLLVAALSLLFIGAILVPGGTWKEVLSILQENGNFNALVLILVLITEVILMRHFQAVSGRRMANHFLKDRIRRIREDSLEPIEEAISRAKAANSPLVDFEILESTKTNFYSITILDMFEHNIFGYSPVYVVGPRLSVFFNEEALAHIR